MMKMLTLFGKDIKELKFNELKRERKCQKRLLSHMKKFIHEEEKAYARHQSQIREDKIKFYKRAGGNLIGRDISTKMDSVRCGIVNASC